MVVKLNLQQLLIFELQRTQVANKSLFNKQTKSFVLIISSKKKIIK